MSCSVDANLLIYAANAAARQHQAADRFLTALIDSEEPLCLAWGVLNAFLRITTDGRIMSRPLTSREARGWLEDLINLPQTRLLSEESGFWNVLCSVAEPLNPRGPDVTDVHLAALLKQHGVRTLYSNDRGFRRFEFLKVVDPLR